MSIVPAPNYSVARGDSEEHTYIIYITLKTKKTNKPRSEKMGLRTCAPAEAFIAPERLSPRAFSLYPMNSQESLNAP